MISKKNIYRKSLFIETLTMDELDVDQSDVDYTVHRPKYLRLNQSMLGGGEHIKIEPTKEGLGQLVR